MFGLPLWLIIVIGIFILVLSITLVVLDFLAWLGGRIFFYDDKKR